MLVALSICALDKVIDNFSLAAAILYWSLAFSAVSNIPPFSTICIVIPAKIKSTIIVTTNAIKVIPFSFKSVLLLSFFILFFPLRIIFNKDV